jgi:NitT/TauT family transport system substrate-binding protein
VSCFAAAAAAAVALLASCSGSGSSSGDSYSGAPLSITVGALPVVDDVGVYIAQEQGIFKQFGLNVTIKPVLQSTQAIGFMQKGTIDMVGGGNYVTFIKLSAADPSNPPYRILAQAASCSTNAFDVLALPKSGIQSAADLAGKTIAVNVANNIQTLMTNNLLTADGVNASKVKFVVIPFPQMVAALESGKVDAIDAVEPFATQSEQEAGAVNVMDQCTGPETALPLSGYISQSSWANANPQAVLRFQQAMSQAQEVADTDSATVQKILPTYIKGLTAEQAATLTLEAFPASLDTDQLDRVSNLMREAGLIKGSITAGSLIKS